MFSLLYGAITGVEYFSDDDETLSSENAKRDDRESQRRELSSSIPSSTSSTNLSQTTVRSLESPQACSIEMSSTDNLTNNVMIGRYHHKSHSAVSSGPTSSLDSWHDSSGSPNARMPKLIASSPNAPAEIRPAKGRHNEASGSCRRRHRLPTP